jgi:hypothetical protein
VETTVTSPNAGTVTIEEAVGGTVPSGFTLLGQQVAITAPAATADAPLVIVFELDASVIPESLNQYSIEVLRDGVAVAPCTGAAGTAQPDPCVSARVLQGDSDVEITVLTSSASDWNFAVRAPQSLAGRNLLIKNKLPDNEKRNKIVLVARDSTVIAGEVGSSADPRCMDAGGSGSGGSLTVRSQAPGGGSHTTNLPCENWRRIGPDPGTGNAPKGYKYTDKKLDDGTCKAVMIRNGQLVKALCFGRGPTNLDYDLQVEQPQAPVDVVLTTGTQRHCLQFGGKIKKDGTNGKTFKAANASAPQPCP